MMNIQASAESRPNCSCGFQGSPAFPSFGYQPSSPTQNANTATPTTIASQLRANRISATADRTLHTSHAPAAVLTK